MSLNLRRQVGVSDFKAQVASFASIVLQRGRSTRHGLVLLLCIALVWGPMVFDLHRFVWQMDPSSQGAIAFILALWLFWHKSRQASARAVIAASQPQPAAGLAWLLPGLVLQVVGRSQGLVALELVALSCCAVGLTVLLYGGALARRLWFCYLFLLFSVPLPLGLADAITQPMKLAVSWAAETLLRAGDWPVARDGVVLHVGAYRLLVADACAGMNALFTLEAMGLLYLNAVRHPSPLRNALMALAIVPIAFLANTLRVVLLACVTLWFGDAATNGLMHDFSGLLLFGLALTLIIGVDAAFRRVARWTDG